MHESPELNPANPPVRVFIEGTPPIAESLGEVRAIMGVLTVVLVETLARRCDYAVGAAVFKKNLNQVQAPDQQARNISAAVELARELRPDQLAFHMLVERVMQVVVPASVAMQAEAFERTTPISDQ